VLEKTIALPMFVEVTSVVFTNVKAVPSMVVLKTAPASIVALALLVFSAISTTAVDALADVGTYPRVFACDTMDERKEALSRNISFASMFALNAR